MSADFPCPTSLPMSVLSMMPTLSSMEQTTASSTPPMVPSTVHVTQTPTNSPDLALPLWLLITIIVAGVIGLTVTCTCVLGIAIFVIRKQSTSAKKGNLHNIIIQNEIDDQASIKSSLSVKQKVGLLYHSISCIIASCKIHIDIIEFIHT